MNQYFRRMRPKKMGGGAYLPRIVILSEAKNLCTLPSAAQTAAGIAKILRLAKKRGPQNDDEKTGRPDWTKRPGELQSVCGWDAAIFFQPLQFFANFDLSVPGILAEAVAFAGKDEQRLRNAEGVERVLEQIVLKHGHADVTSSGDHVRGRFHFVDLENGGFVVVALRGFPRTSAEKVGVVVGGVVIAPVADVLHGSGSGDRGLEARGLSNEPIGHVSAIAVSADGEVVRIGEAIFDECVDTGEDVFARTRNDLRHDFGEKLVAVSGRAAVVGTEHQPSVGGGKT